MAWRATSACTCRLRFPAVSKSCDNKALQHKHQTKVTHTHAPWHVSEISSRKVLFASNVLSTCARHCSWVLWSCSRRVNQTFINQWEFHIISLRDDTSNQSLRAQSTKMNAMMIWLTQVLDSDSVYSVTGRPSTSTVIENLLFPNSMLTEALPRKI